MDKKTESADNLEANNSIGLSRSSTQYGIGFSCEGCANACAGEIGIDINDEARGKLVHDVADFFKVFGDSTRIRILSLLLEGDLAVGEIVERLDMTQSAVSHQLRILRQNDLVKYTKKGKMVIYALDDEHIHTVLNQGISHVKHKRGY